MDLTDLKMAMARARAEADGQTIDLDRPEPEPSKAKEWLRRAAQYLYGGGLASDLYGERVESSGEPIKLLAPELDKPLLEAHGRVMSGPGMANPLAAPFVMADKVAQWGQRVEDESVKKAEADKEKKQRADNLKKAIENAKKAKEYLDQQKKVQADREQAVSEGRPGYRTERALYDSTLYRK